MTPTRLDIEVETALAAADVETASPIERAQMLMEIALGLQQRPRTPEHIAAAIGLYDRALDVCPAEDLLLRARLKARQASALQTVPGPGIDALLAARGGYESALPDLRAGGGAAEVAEVELNLGLVLQSLAAVGAARLGDAIAAYQRALRVFDAPRYPVEYAILQSNLATAFLSMPPDDKAPLREALAVQAFEEGLKVVSLIDHPVEYAMLQNNLGNALQYAASAHSLENNLRALQAYDEALKVRRPDTAPVEYANTIANRANCLLNLPDEAMPDGAIPGRNRATAQAHYEDAHRIFVAHGEIEKAALLAEQMAALAAEATG